MDVPLTSFRTYHILAGSHIETSSDSLQSKANYRYLCDQEPIKLASKWELTKND